MYTAVAPDLSPWVTGLRALRHTDTAWWKDTWLQMIFSDYPRNVPLCRPAQTLPASKARVGAEEGTQAGLEEAGLRS